MFSTTLETKCRQSQGKAMAYLSFCQAPAAEAEAETMSTEVKENPEAVAAAAVEPLSCTLTLKKLMIILRTATY